MCPGFRCIFNAYILKQNNHCLTAFLDSMTLEASEGCWLRQECVSPSVASWGCFSPYSGGLVSSHPGKGVPGLCDVNSDSFLRSVASCLAPCLHSGQQGCLWALIFSPVTSPSLCGWWPLAGSRKRRLTEPRFISYTKRRCSSVVEPLSSTCEALGPCFRTTENSCSWIIRINQNLFTPFVLWKCCETHTCTWTYACTYILIHAWIIF